MLGEEPTHANVFSFVGTIAIPYVGIPPVGVPIEDA